MAVDTVIYFEGHGLSQEFWEKVGADSSGQNVRFYSDSGYINELKRRGLSNTFSK